jgi:hypothetical protein
LNARLPRHVGVTSRSAFSITVKPIYRAATRQPNYRAHSATELPSRNAATEPPRAQRNRTTERAAQPNHRGFAVPFVSYLLISVPINGLFVTGFVLTGGAIFEGQIGLLILGISILIAAALTIKIIRGRIN